MKVQDVLQKSTYKIELGRYCVAKVAETDSINYANCFMVSKDKLETTVICKEELMQGLYLEIKKDYHLIAINVAYPFYSPGFIATISGEMALRNIPVLVVSTFSRDYFLIQGRDIDNAVLALDNLGIKRKLNP